MCDHGLNIQSNCANCQKKQKELNFLFLWLINQQFLIKTPKKPSEKLSN